jgi:DNA-binding MarR family transcriptional regulator/GNAT superfamily N-acetyltransferase
MQTSTLPDRIDAVRHFNRFYTRQIGVLQETLLSSRFSLTEMRVLYELAYSPQLTASDLIARLGLDGGYLSRILSRFERDGLLRKTSAAHDARQSILTLTSRGRKTFTPLEEASKQDVRRLLDKLSEPSQAQLLAAMQSIESLISEQSTPSGGDVELRSHKAGDMGWVVKRHAEIYAQEYGWNEEFEALIAQLCADFIRKLDPARERCWIAERAGERLGCIFVVEESKTIARLRMLLVEPTARGLGVGTKLVDECLAFARAAGYRKMVLWTNDVLAAARRRYEAVGFRLVKEERHESFGKNLVGQNWELELS